MSYVPIKAAQNVTVFSRSTKTLSALNQVKACDRSEEISNHFAVTAAILAL